MRTYCKHLPSLFLIYLFLFNLFLHFFFSSFQCYCDKGLVTSTCRHQHANNEGTLVMMTEGPAQAFRRGRSQAALLTALLPLVVSLLLWSSHSAAQESRNMSVSNVTFKNGDLGFADDGEDAAEGNTIKKSKPVLYVNNPQLLREMQQQSFLKHNFR